MVDFGSPKPENKIMSISLSHYRTCIIRVWIEEDADEERSWRLTIETPSTGAREGFSSREEFVDALFQHLFVDDVEDDVTESR